jgi:hypothetical protein
MFSDIPSYPVEEVQLNEQDWESLVHEYNCSENDASQSDKSFQEN